MKIKNISEMVDELQNWEFLRLLPEKIGEFQLQKPFEKLELELIVVRYKGYDDRSLELCYTQETGDFVVVKNVGLFRFRDDRYYCCDKDVFAARLLPNIVGEVGDLSMSVIHSYPFTAQDLEFDKWKDWEKFPRQYGNFQLYITPENPLKYLNGSWVLFAYEDRVNKHQLAIFYNEYRNEVFAELKRGGIYEYTNKFDVTYDDNAYQNKRKLFLQQVTEKMGKNLVSTLENLSSEKSS